MARMPPTSISIGRCALSTNRAAQIKLTQTIARNKLKALEIPSGSMPRNNNKDMELNK